MKTIFIVIICKIIYHLSRLSGKQGVTLAGQVAFKLDKNILTKLSRQVRKKIIVVCGTNGKTTTNNLIACGLSANGQKVIYNQTGSNMLNGIVACFILHSSLTGNIDADYACLEIDEASLRRITPYLKADIMVLTNLFRDQLDRYGEIDITMNLLEEGLNYCPNCELIINADDVLSYSFARKVNHKFMTFGVEKPVLEQIEEMREGQFCKECNTRLEYRFYHYSQLGDYYCPKCGLKRPHIDVNGEDIRYKDHCEVTVDNYQISSNYRGFYNIYNILASCCVLKHEGFNYEEFNKVLNHFNPENGRLENFVINGVHVTLNLAKNPAGFNQNILLCCNDDKPKDVIILINDNAQDGIDVSWLWDVDFDRFKNDHVVRYMTTGTRYKDMQLRLKYVDIDSVAYDNYEKAIKEAIKTSENKNLYVLVNYTGLYTTHVFLTKLAKEKHGNI